MSKTPNQKEWEEQVKRIKKFIERETKRGFIFPSFSELLPEQPKRINKKRLQAFKNLKPNDLYKTAKYVDKETGLIISGEEAFKTKAFNRNIRSILDRNKAITPKEYNFNNASNMVFSQFKQMISPYRAEFQNYMNSWIDKLIKEYGENAVAEMLQEGAYNGLIITYQLSYDYKLLTQYVSDMLEYLPTDGFVDAQKIIDEVEQLQGDVLDES